MFKRIILCFTFVFLSSFSNVVLAEDPPYPIEDSLKEAALFYMADNHVSLKTAKFRLKLQKKISKLSSEIKSQREDEFSGLYVQHQPRYRINVLYKPKKHRGHGHKKSFQHFVAHLLKKKEFKKLRKYIKLKKVDSSLNELRQLQNEASQMASSIGFPVDSDINIKTGEVYIGTTDIDGFNGALASEGLNLPIGVNLVEIESLSGTEANIHGGLRLDRSVPGFTSTCTSGFSVIHNVTGVRGISTAAHCERINGVQVVMKFGGVVLPKVAEDYTGSADLAWHSVPSSLTALNGFRVCDPGNVNCRWVVINSTSEMNVGDHICKFGLTTARTCGYVDSITSRAARVTNSNATFVKVSFRGNKISDGGDSGGPWYDVNSAVGIHHGSGPNLWGLPGTFSMYTPVRFLTESFNVRVLTN